MLWYRSYRIGCVDGTPCIDDLDNDGDVDVDDRTLLMAELGQTCSPGRTIYYYHNDHLGTPQKMIDSSGTVVWAADYLPFGKVDVTVNTIENNLRFAGQYFDAETGWHYNYHRYYDPATGRYLTPDPIGLAGGTNLFAYASNNPVAFIDPFGLDFITPKQAKKIIEAAKIWEGTPYANRNSIYAGENAVRGKGADCSGATNAIYNEAGFKYSYMDSKNFPNSPEFRPSPKNQPQLGDVGQWNGHLLIYDPNAGSNMNAWTTRSSKNQYTTGKYQWWEKALETKVTWYRYYLTDTENLNPLQDDLCE